VSRGPAQIFAIRDRTPSPCYVGTLSLLMRPRKRSIVCCQLEFPSFPIVHEHLEAARPAYIVHEAVEAQGIRTLLARPLRDHNGTLETLD
jgi:hypothetical protein